MTSRNNNVRTDESGPIAGSVKRCGDGAEVGTKPRKRGKRQQAVKEAGAVAAAAEAAQPPRKVRPHSPPDTKASLVLGKLRTPLGISMADLIAATGWQAHSVRGFLSGTVKTKLALPLVSEIGKDCVRRYRIVSDRAVGEDAASTSRTTEVA